MKIKLKEISIQSFVTEPQKMKGGTIVSGTGICISNFQTSCEHCTWSFRMDCAPETMNPTC